MNYANDDQIPFGNGPLDPNDLAREYGPAPNDQRHRLVVSGSRRPGRAVSAGRVVDDRVGRADGHPDARRAVAHSAAVAQCRRTAFHVGGRAERLHSRRERRGRRRRRTAADGVGQRALQRQLQLARPPAVARRSRSARSRIDALAEVFNLFNTTNILGTSTVNYSGFANVLVRDSNDPANPGYLHSSRFGTPVTTAGGVFGSGGPARPAARRPVSRSESHRRDGASRPRARARPVVGDRAGRRAHRSPLASSSRRRRSDRRAGVAGPDDRRLDRLRRAGPGRRPDVRRTRRAISRRPAAPTSTCAKAWGERARVSLRLAVAADHGSRRHRRARRRPRRSTSIVLWPAAAGAERAIALGVDLDRWRSVPWRDCSLSARALGALTALKVLVLGAIVVLAFTSGRRAVVAFRDVCRRARGRTAARRGAGVGPGRRLLLVWRLLGSEPDRRRDRSAAGRTLPRALALGVVCRDARLRRDDVRVHLSRAGRSGHERGGVRAPRR